METLTPSVNFNHFINPEFKDAAWAAKVFEELYLYGGAMNLLHGKNPEVINKYFDGNQPMEKYKKMFKRLAKKADEDSPEKDITNIDWEPLGLMVNFANNALATIQKMPLYVKATAIDPLAQEKKQRDVQYLKSRPVLDGELDSVSDTLGVRFGSPAAQNNADGVDIKNFSLNPANDDELNFYINMFYKLRPESAFENVLLALAYVKKLKEIRDLEAIDQFKFGRSANRAYFSDVTGLPMAEYLYPGEVFVPSSDLKDYNDAPFIYLKKQMNAEMLMDAMGNTLSDKEIEVIFNAYFTHRGWNFKWNTLDMREKRKMTVEVVYMEIKSWDLLKIHKRKSKTGGYMVSEIVPYDYQLMYSYTHPDAKLRGKMKKPTPEEFIDKRFIQNTYVGYWFPFFPNTVYKFKKLEGVNREAGRESMSSFSINIYKSQEKGAVELCMPIIDDAQRAYFKMQHNIIMSKPKGVYIDLRYMRQAVFNMNGELNMGMKELVASFAENNIFFGDSEGIDPEEQASGARPFYEIPGGVGKEIEGYILVISNAIERLGTLTGTGGLTNTAPNPEGLIGMQKLLLQGSLNSIYWMALSAKFQTEKVFRTWAYQVQLILKDRNSPSAKAIEAILSSYKVDALRDLHTIPAHVFGIMVENVPTEAEQEELHQILLQLVTYDKITSMDYFTLRRVLNYKDAQQLLAIRDRKAKEEKNRETAVAIQAQQQEKQTEVQGKLQASQITAQGGVQKEQIRTEADKFIASMNGKIALMLKQLDGTIKDQLQAKRMEGQLNKTRESANLSAQAPVQV